MRLNAALEDMLTSTFPTIESTSILDHTALTSLLTARDASTHRLPCLRAAIAIVDRDIERDLADVLLRVSESYPNLRVFFFSVAPSANQARDMHNIVSLECNIGAVLEYSDVDVQAIGERAGTVQSYLNYLSTSGAPYKIIM